MKFVFATVLAIGAASASAVPLVGLTSNGQLAFFDSASAGSATTVNITGLMAGESLVGIDVRPTNQLIYGITTQNRIFTVATNGMASFVAALVPSAGVSTSMAYGIDFNPVADAGGMASLRLISSSGMNFAVNATTGAVTTGSTIAAGNSNVAYTPASGGATSLYYINSSSDALWVATSNFNMPALAFVGNLGVDVLRAGGFDIDASGAGFAALNTDDGPLDTGIYSINLTNGSATLLSTYNGTLTGLTVAPIPEPATYGMFGLGLLALGMLKRRRAQKD